MKIAIIEDRIGRLEQFIEFDILKHKSVRLITGPDFEKLIGSLNVKETKDLDQYSCIAVHRSALTNELRDTITEYSKARNKPLIFFSGGITSSVFKDLDFPFLHINSKDFYSSNLKLFIDNCEQNNSVNLLMLQFGNKWKLSLLMNLRNNIVVAQNKNDLKYIYPDIEFDERELIKRVRDLQINSLIRQDLITEKTKSILTANDFMSITNEHIKEVKSVINHLINDNV
jgi:hypothetical protein